MSFLKYAAKRATYDLMRAGVRDSFRSIAAAEKSASAVQMRALSAHFLQAARAMPVEEVVGFVDAGNGDRRPVTAGNVLSVLEIVKDGGLSFYIVENGKAQLLPPNAIKALCLAAKAQARLDELAPPSLPHSEAPPAPLMLRAPFAPQLGQEPLIDPKTIKLGLILTAILMLGAFVVLVWGASLPQPY